MSYNARYYDPALGRFISPDTLVPKPSNPQDLNRYTYVLNNPVRHIDPSGHCVPYVQDGCLPIWETGGGLNWSDGLDNLQGGLDVLGLIPGVGEAADGANAAIYTMRGDAVNATLSAAAMVPFLGAGATAAKGALKYGDEAVGLLDGAVTLADDAASIVGNAHHAPDFVVTPKGEAIPIPQGAAGPYQTANQKGFEFVGGQGGNGLHANAASVRIMDSTPPQGPSPGYPGGYVNYRNRANQPIDPYTGQTVGKQDHWWHAPLKE